MRMVHVAMVNVLATPIIVQIDCALQTLNENPFDLIQPDDSVGAVIELGCARRLMIRDLVRVLNCTAALPAVRWSDVATQGSEGGTTRSG